MSAGGGDAGDAERMARVATGDLDEPVTPRRRRWRAGVLAAIGVVAFLHAQIWVANHVLGMTVSFDPRSTGTLFLAELPLFLVAILVWRKRRV